jgi:ribosomal-protein-alanine N-acetyltransferase
MTCTRDDYSIFPLKEKDASELAALEAACFSSAWSGEQYARLLRGVEEALTRAAASARGNCPPFLVIGARAPTGRLAAYISLGLHSASGEMEIYSIAVHGDFRRQGLGRTLLERALDIGKGLDLTRALLEVRTGNAAALALYFSVGFCRRGRRKAYYADTGEDALVLSRELTANGIKREQP